MFEKQNKNKEREREREREGKVRKRKSCLATSENILEDKLSEKGKGKGKEMKC